MAYYIPPRNSNTTRLSFLPISWVSKTGRRVTLDHYEADTDTNQLHILVANVIQEGTSYPQIDLSDVNDFKAYYLSHDVFVLKDSTDGSIVGAFYVKPNFPGRCSHICNAGFVVGQEARGEGLGSFMGKEFLRIAPGLGYQAAFFNLVFVNNSASIHMWRKFGFTELCRIPEAGDLKGLGLTDAIQFYKKFDSLTLDDIHKDN